MNTNAEIIAGKSIADILIKENISHYIEDIYSTTNNVEILEYPNNPIPVTQYIINNELLKITTLMNGEIIGIFCQLPYGGKYKKFYTPSLSLKEVISASEKQLLIHGFLILDKDFGAGYVIPEDFSEADYIEELPLNLVLKEMFVMSKNWWK